MHFGLRTITWTSDSYASIVQHTDMIACHSISEHKNQTVYQTQLPAERIFYTRKNNTVYSNRFLQFFTFPVQISILM